MKILPVMGLIMFASIVSVYTIPRNDELKRAEAQLEQTAGAKLKDTWPAFRDSLCKDMAGRELNDCRIYQTLLFEKQIRLYNSR